MATGSTTKVTAVKKAAAPRAKAPAAEVQVRVSRFEEILSRSNADIRKDRAKRITSSVVDAQQKFIMDLNSTIRKKENELDSLLDLSTSNENTSMNVIHPNFNPEDYVQKINTLVLDIELKKQELVVALEVQEDLF
jgi:hypothetical protein